MTEFEEALALNRESAESDIPVIVDLDRLEHYTRSFLFDGLAVVNNIMKRSAEPGDRIKAYNAILSTAKYVEQCKQAQVSEPLEISFEEEADGGEV